MAKRYAIALPWSADTVRCSSGSRTSEWSSDACLLMIGSGGVGARPRRSRRRAFFDSWVVADYDLARAEVLVGKSIGDDRFRAARWTRPDAEAVAELCQDNQVTHVLNVVDPGS